MRKFDIHLQYGKGFQWAQLDNIYVKGYAVIDGIYYNENMIAEYLSQNILRNGLEDFLSQAYGHYSLVLDNDDYAIIVADPMRAYPVFYAFKDRKWFISDDSVGLAEKLGISKLSSKGKVEFLAAGFVSKSDTLAEEIHQASCATIVRLSANNTVPVTENYYQYRMQPHQVLDIERCMRDLDARMVYVFRRLIASLNGKTAVIPLSGGQDSRIIAVMLKRLEYNKVICFTYGTQTSNEVVTAKKLCETLGFPWIYVKYDAESWRNILKGEAADDYVLFAGGLGSRAHVQDFPAVRYLRENELIPEDSIFIPGHSYCYLAGVQLYSSIFDYESIPAWLFRYGMFSRHYSSVRCRRGIWEIFRQNLLEPETCKREIDRDVAILNFQKINWMERQVKLIVHSVRVYEYYGYEWRIPLWDRELVDFWEKIPYEYLRNRRMHFLYYDKYIAPIAGIREVTSFPTMILRPTRKEIIKRFFGWVEFHVPIRDIGFQQQYIRDKLNDHNAFYSCFTRRELAHMYRRYGYNSSINSYLNDRQIHLIERILQTNMNPKSIKKK